ncbi:MAG: glycosyltransferase family 4 protein [Chloroflexi bacterium]|nr:glycosyltransferase family 4 protein [Chloroflexota bacterium]
MKPTPVLFVDHASALGGAENSLLLLMQHIDRKQWEPHLACVDGKLMEMATAVSIPTHPLSFPQLRRSPAFLSNLWQGAGSIVNIAKKTGATLLHANTVRAALYTAVAAKRSRLPFVWHMRDFWLSETKPSRLWLDRWGKQWLCSAATIVIANSHAVARQLPYQKKVRVVHNGIDLTQFEQTAVSFTFRHQFNIPTDVPLVGTVGRLRPWKGQDKFIQIAAEVVKNNPSVHFVIVGGSPFQVNDDFEQELHQLVTKHNLSNRISFTGHLQDVGSALAELDIFVHVGTPEPFGLVNVEAMAMGKPVVAFAYGALPEIVMHKETGLLVQPKNEAEMVTAVTQLLNQPDKRIEMGRNGRLRVQSHFNIQRVARNVENIYSGIFQK